MPERFARHRSVASLVLADGGRWANPRPAVGFGRLGRQTAIASIEVARSPASRGVGEDVSPPPMDQRRGPRRFQGQSPGPGYSPGSRRSTSSRRPCGPGPGGRTARPRAWPEPSRAESEQAATTSSNRFSSRSDLTRTSRASGCVGDRPERRSSQSSRASEWWPPGDQKQAGPPGPIGGGLGDVPGRLEPDRLGQIGPRGRARRASAARAVAPVEPDQGPAPVERGEVGLEGSSPG